MINKKFKKHIEKLNKIDKLDEILKRKYDLYTTAKNGTPVNEIFDWEQFEKIFKTITVQFSFQYRDIMFTLFNCGKYAEFWIDGDDKNSYASFVSPTTLLHAVVIDRHALSEIWNQLKVSA